MVASIERFISARRGGTILLSPTTTGPRPSGSRSFSRHCFDAHRLAHLFHSHEVAVVAVAVLADRDVEIELGIAFVGLRFAQIPGGTGAAHHHSRKAPPPGIRELDLGDADVALLEDAIFREQALKVVADPQERITKRPDVVEELRRQILVHAANPKIIGVHACTRGALVRYHQLLAFLEPPQRRGNRPDIQRLRRYVEEMREQTPDLAIEHTNELTALGHLDAKELLHC
jgi:hypothetical protein